MSARIPETMLLSDLLKPTGYDCPEDLQGKTFEEATTGGDAKISTNTAKTIDVSAYTEPVVVEPAEGYDATKKVTVTLDNIPAGADLESNHAATIDVSQYTEPVEIEPTAGKDGMEKVTVTLNNIPSPTPGGSAAAYAWTTPGRNPFWFEFATAPADKEAMDAAKYLDIKVTDGTASAISIATGFFGDSEYTYTRDSDTQFTVNMGGTDAVFTRDSTKDATIWG